MRNLLRALRNETDSHELEESTQHSLLQKLQRHARTDQAGDRKQKGVGMHVSPKEAYIAFLFDASSLRTR